MAQAVVSADSNAASAKAARPRRSMGDWVRLIAATNAVTLVINLLTGVISARVMGPGGKGVFNGVSVWGGVFGSLAGMGVSTAFITAYAKAAPEDRPGLVRAGLFLTIGWGIVGSLAVYFLEPRLVGHLASGAATWARLNSPIVLLTVVSGMGGAILSVTQRFGSLNWMGFARTVLYAAGVSGLALTARLGPYSLLGVSWALAAGAAILVLAVACPGVVRAGRVRLRDLRLLSGLGIRFYSLGLLSMFNSQLDQMIASAWLTARDMGLYAVAISSMSVMGIMQNAVGAVMYPMMAGDDRDAIIARTARVMRRMTPVFLILLLLMWAGAWPVLTFLYGPAYAGAVPVVLVIAPTAAFIGGITIFYQGCYALRWFAGPSIGEAVGAGSGAILLALLIPPWGLTGAAVAAVVSYALDFTVVTIFWCRASGTSVRDLVFRWEDVRLLFGELHRIPVVSRLWARAAE